VRHFLDVVDLSPAELEVVLDLAQASDPPRVLAGRGAALLFEKPSARTRHATEMAVVQLGGHPVYTRAEELGLDTREPVEDVTRILAGYHGVLAGRVFAHTTLERMAAVSTVPVVNLLSDRSHPMQALADALTLREVLGHDLSGRTIAYIGDYNNVARSLGEVCALLGMHVRFACPPGYDADVAELERLQLLGGPSASQTTRPAVAIAGADVVYTDTWTSMGQEAEAAERRRAFEGFTIDAALMGQAAPGAIFLHCLPAHRGEEVAHDVIDGPASQVIRQGHNRMHASRAAMAHLLEASR
jgi:ornithine carbamoyltransferase